MLLVAVVIVTLLEPEKLASVAYDTAEYIIGGTLVVVEHRRLPDV